MPWQVAAISGKTDIGANLGGTDEILVSDAGVLRRADISRLNNYLNGALAFNNYMHPTHPGDDFSVDSGALSGAVVISDIDINITTDTQGHVLDANAFINTRSLTAANIGAATTGHTHETFDHSAHLAGANVFDQINVTNGIVTSILTRALTSPNIGAAPTAHSHTTPEISGLT